MKYRVFSIEVGWSLITVYELGSLLTSLLARLLVRDLLCEERTRNVDILVTELLDILLVLLSACLW